MVNNDNNDLDSLPDVIDEFTPNENKPLYILMENREFKNKNPLPILNVVSGKEQQRQLQSM